MAYSDVRYTDEALRRMAERAISPDEVEEVLTSGMVLRRYPETDPESHLMLAWTNGMPRQEGFPAGTYPKGRPVHVVASDHADVEATYVITTYEPDPGQWEDAFRWRKSWRSAKNTWREKR